jgi:hypothetical protein
MTSNALPRRQPSEAPRSGLRRVAVRVPADLRVVVARQGGQKQAARVVDLSVHGMHLEASDVPNYGEAVTIVVRLQPERDWLVLPATVRSEPHARAGSLRRIGLRLAVA